MKTFHSLFFVASFFVITLVASEKRLSPLTVVWADTQIPGFKYGSPNDLLHPAGALVANQQERDRFFLATRQSFAQQLGLTIATDESQVYAQDAKSSYLFLQNLRCAGGLVWAYIGKEQSQSSSPQRKSLSCAIKS